MTKLFYVSKSDRYANRVLYAIIMGGFGAMIGCTFAHVITATPEHKNNIYTGIGAGVGLVAGLLCLYSRIRGNNEIAWFTSPYTPEPECDLDGGPICYCGDCGERMTLVRPGKHQCDNESCTGNAP
jgi:hypothetical protein